MNKILVTLLVPEIGKEFEVFLPLHKSIGEVETLLRKAFFELTQGIYQKPEIHLYNEKGEVLPRSAYISHGLLSNGDKLLVL